MKTFEFTLKFILGNPFVDPKIYAEKLYESGCDDALIGIGLKGRIALDFCRDGLDAESTVKSAIADVMKVIPDAKLIEASPDIAGITELSKLLNCSRQNMRKLISHNYETFPAPIHEEQSMALYNTSSVISWINIHQDSYTIDDSVYEVALVNKKVNLHNLLGVSGYLVVSESNDVQSFEYESALLEPTLVVSNKKPEVSSWSNDKGISTTELFGVGFAHA